MKTSKLAFLLLLPSLVFSVSAQTNGKPAKKPAAKTVQTKPQIAEDAPDVKKNQRPVETEPDLATENTNEPVKKNAHAAKLNSQPEAAKANPAVYFYEFSQPNFFVSKVLIEHDENGKGEIKFEKQHFNEFITDPIQLSPAALERIKGVWNALNFLDSTEDYQYEKDYSHLGNMTFTMRKDGRERAAKFNWTTNPNAKNLADEYRRVSQQFVWIFDIGIARENQPLEAPQLMDTLDSLIKRNEISDAAQMIPLLKQLSNDERIPLIARNHATRIIKDVEKKAEKK